MSDKKINLEKVIGSLGENTFPNIIYFKNGVENGYDGSVDGSNDELYKGLIHGEGFDVLAIDKSVLESENPILELCKIILEKGGTLFFWLGLIYGEEFDQVAIDDEWIDVDDSYMHYNNGGYGIYLSNDGWDYGYFVIEMAHCFIPPKFYYYYLPEDKVAGIIRKHVDEIDIYD